MRENEILFFLLIIIMVKSRKSGATHTAAAYLASGFIYAKVSFRYLSRFFVRGAHETTDASKAKSQKEVIFFLTHLFARDILLMKKLEIEEIFKTDIIKVGLVFSISNFFINKSSPTNKWMSFSCSNSALE